MIYSEAAAAHWTQRWTLLALLCMSLAFWMLLHPYRGLEHDTVLYSVLALARLHPAALGHDLFVRYGTQDHYTLFGSLFAETIRVLGLEPGAAILTFGTQVAFFGAAWMLARRLMPSTQALLGAGVLAVLPSWYGASYVFAYIEDFLTPRQAAEAFVLAGIAAVLYARPLLAGSFMLTALLLHPIIASAGLALWLIITMGLTRPRLMALLIGLLGLALIGGGISGLGPFRHFDAVWFGTLYSRLTYLFPTLWTPSEWLAMGIRAAVLLVGVRYGADPLLRRLCGATLITAALGLVFTIVENDWLHVIIAGQMQIWRWLWLPGVLSVLLAPAIAISCWRTGGVARAAAVLLLAAWLTRVDLLAVVPLALACAAALVPTAVLNARHKRLIELGAYVLLAASLLQVVQEIRDTLPQLAVMRTRHDAYLVAIGQARLLCYDGLLPAALLVLASWSADHGLLRGAPLLGAAGALLLISILPNALRTWTHVRYPVERYQAFAPWRTAIPESAEVLWPDPPTLTWFELGRASYWSLYQMSGMVFSRDVTMVTTSREQAVTPMLPLLGRKINGTRYEIPDDSSRDEPRDMSAPCRLPGVIYYASWIDLGPTPYPAVHPDIENPRATLYLYRCSGDPQ